MSEIATVLRVSEEAARKRVDRAIEKLHSKLRDRKPLIGTLPSSLRRFALARLLSQELRFGLSLSAVSHRELRRDQACHRKDGG